MHPTCMETSLRQRLAALAPMLSERQRCLWAAAEAQALGDGGVTAVARLTGVSRRAIHAGLQDRFQTDDSVVCRSERGVWVRVPLRDVSASGAGVS